MTYISNLNGSTQSKSQSKFYQGFIIIWGCYKGDITDSRQTNTRHDKPRYNKHNKNSKNGIYADCFNKSK